MGIEAEVVSAVGIGAEEPDVELEESVEPEAADGAAVQIESTFFFQTSSLFLTSSCSTNKQSLYLRAPAAVSCIF